MAKTNNYLAALTPKTEPGLAFKPVSALAIPSGQPAETPSPPHTSVEIVKTTTTALRNIARQRWWREYPNSTPKLATRGTQSIAVKVDGVCRGCVTLLRKDKARVGTTPVIAIDTVYIEPKFRGLGLGELLFSYAVNKRKARLIRLDVPYYEAHRDFYERNEFHLLLTYFDWAWLAHKEIQHYHTGKR